MLAPNEFTAGSIASAAPLSLMLPRTSYEHPMIVGVQEGEPVGVILSGEYAFCCITRSSFPNWTGLIVPNIQLELDEKSIFSPGHGNNAIGTITRLDTRLVIQAKSEQSFMKNIVTLIDGLRFMEEERVGFNKWQIVIGEKNDKRVLWRSFE